MEQEILKRKEELEFLIESLVNLRNKDCLSTIGKEYLKGLQRAYDMVFPIQIVDE